MPVKKWAASIANPGRVALSAGRWTLDAGRWTLDAGRWTLDAGRWTLDADNAKPDPMPWQALSNAFFMVHRGLAGRVAPAGGGRAAPIRVNRRVADANNDKPFQERKGDPYCSVTSKTSIQIMPRSRRGKRPRRRSAWPRMPWAVGDSLASKLPTAASWHDPWETSLLANTAVGSPFRYRPVPMIEAPWPSKPR